MKKFSYLIAIVAVLSLVFVLGSCGGNGLEFEKGEDGYYVTGRGSNTDTELEIPDSYWFSDVTGIQAGAFEGCTDIVSVTLPETITGIGGSAFEDCTSLETINIPNSVTMIGDAAFAGCTALKNVELPDTMESVQYNAFRGVPACETVDGVTYLGKWALSFDFSLEEITIREGTVGIGNYPYYETSIQTINFPKSLKQFYIYSNYANKTINYPGTISQWKAILTNTQTLSPVKDCTVVCTDGTLVYKDMDVMP